MVNDIKLNNPLSDAYPNVPGNRTNYLEDQFNPKNNTPITVDAETGSILLIGSATDGPVGEPVSVRNSGGIKQALEMFGGLTKKIEYMENGRKRAVEIPNNNNLTRAMMEAHNNGSDDIRVLRVDGKDSRTEVFAADPNSIIRQPLSDNTGSNVMNGNNRFLIDIQLDEGQRFLNIVKIEEIDEDGEILVTKEGKEGYTDLVEGFTNNIEVHFKENMYNPGSTLKVYFKVSVRNYINVDYMSPEGLLTHDTTNERYFSSVNENWSDEPIHPINLFIVEKGGNPDGSDKPTAVPLVIDGKFIYRPGLEDPTVGNEMTVYPTPEEFRQGGIRFTAEYDKHVAEGLFPSLSKTNLVCMADYTRYESTVTEDTREQEAVGQNKSRALRTTPDLDTLVVTYEFDGDKKELEIDKDFKLILGATSAEKDYIIIEVGSAPIGSKLYAEYSGVGASGDSGTITILSKYPGSVYASLEYPEDRDSIRGVSFSIEYGTDKDGLPNLDTRVLRIKKPKEKQMTSTDSELVYSSQELKEIKTVSQLVNFIGNDPRNNVVRFELAKGTGSLLFNSLVPTNHTQNPNTGVYEYEDIYLGFKLNEQGKYELYQNEALEFTDPDRYPWLGNDGIYDNTNMVEMLKYYDKLGGVYGFDYDRSTTEEVLLHPGIFTDLENYPVDQVRLVDVYANTAIAAFDEFGEVELDKNKNFASQLAQFCATLSARTDYSTGVIDMVPLPSTKLRDVQEAIDLYAGDRVPNEEIVEKYLANGANPYYKNVHNLYNPVTGEEVFNDSAQPIDVGFFISVIFGPEVALSEAKLGGYVAPGGTMLTSLISTLPVNVSTTNHQIDILGLRYTLSAPQHEQLLSAGYVTFDLEADRSSRAKYIVKDGVTAGAPNSDYRLLSTIRITNLAVHEVRMATKDYVGKSGGIAQDNSMSTDVKVALDRLKEAGVLTDYRFILESDISERLVKNVFIELEIVPAFEVRRIRTTVSVTDSLN